MCIIGLIAALFRIANMKSTNVFIYRLMNIEEVVYINKTEYYSATNRKEIGSFVELSMDLESVIQSEVSQKEKNKYRLLAQIYGI